MGEKDAVEKTLFGYNDVFANICNAIIYDGDAVIKPEDLTNAVASSSYKFADKFHSQDRDVAKLWKNGEIRLAIFGIENQTNYDPDMPLRVMSYDSAAYRGQIAEDPDPGYNGFRYPVITFVLNFSTDVRWKNKRLLDRVKVPNELARFVSDYTINVIDLAWLSEETIKRFHGEMRFIVEYLSAVRQDKDFKPSPETVTHYEELLQLFSLLSGIKYENMTGLFQEEERQKEEITMNAVMERMFANARAEGNRIGRAEGRTEGRAEGRAEGKLSVLTTLVGQGTLTLQQAAAFLNIPVEEFQQRAQTMAG